MTDDRGATSTVVGVATVLVVGVAGFAGWAWLTGSVGPLPIREHCSATAIGTATALDPDQAGNAAIITAVAVRRGLPARAATIGIATAMQESKLRNLDYGDRDSLGLFQQRPSQGWGTPAQVKDPVHAANAFYDALVKIEGYQNLPITKVAQKIQRSAYPAAYAAHEPEARIAASALSGYSPAAFTCVLRDASHTSATTPSDAKSATPRASAVITAGAKEAGRTGQVVSGDGTAVRFVLAGREGRRLGWSLAQWAVARAEGLAIEAVQVDGKQWRRDHRDEGWTTVTNGPPPGTVIVKVARGA